MGERIEREHCWMAAVSFTIAERLLLLEENLSPYHTQLKQGVEANADVVAQRLVEYGLRPAGDWLWEDAYGNSIAERAVNTALLGQAHFMNVNFMEPTTLQELIRYL